MQIDLSKIDLNMLGNRIENEKMRNAFFIFCADVATYVEYSHGKDEDEEPWSIEEHAEMLVKETDAIYTDISRKLIGDGSLTCPFDIGHRMVHIMAKMFEKDPKLEEEKIKTFIDISNKEKGDQKCKK